MAGRLTLWGAGEILRSFFSRATTPPTDFYLAVIKDIAPTPYISGAEIDEPVGGGYERVAIPNDAVNWGSDGSLHTISVITDQVFKVATANWGVIRYWAICNAAVDGYVYFCGKIETDNLINVETGDTVILGEGDLTVQLGPFFTEEP